MKYVSPDLSQWAEDDPRRQVVGFDEGKFRAYYNELMPRELQPMEQNDYEISGWQYFHENIKARNGRLLDIGCGNGGSLVALMQNGYMESGKGIDISDEVVKIAHQSAANNNVKLSFDRVAIEEYMPDKPYDIILASEVLEHIYSLRFTLSRIASWLVSDGLFCGSVPLDRICDSITHLHYFTFSSLNELLGVFFENTTIKPKDITGQGEVHLVFICSHPRRNVDE